MHDAFGTELRVGMVVAYAAATSGGGVNFSRRVIAGFTPHTVRVLPEHAPATRTPTNVKPSSLIAFQVQD